MSNNFCYYKVGRAKTLWGEIKKHKQFDSALKIIFSNCNALSVILLFSPSFEIYNFNRKQIKPWRS